MPVYTHAFPIKGTTINSDEARLFRSIVTGGWANESEGNVEAPTGHFAKVSISVAELREIYEAFEDDDNINFLHSGFFFVQEDSAGNTTLTEYTSSLHLNHVFDEQAREFRKWDTSDETHYLVCGECGVPFETIEIALAHVNHGQCEDVKFSVLPESEAY